MKQIITFLLILALSTSLLSQIQYSRARINLVNTEVADVVSIGIDLNEGVYKKGVFFETDLSEYEIMKLNNNGIPVEILIEDVSEFYKERLKATTSIEIVREINDEWTVPENWEYGSMGGYYTLDEIYSELDDMAEMYPNLVSPRLPISIDTLTHEGRKQYWLKISDNPNTNEDEPEVLYTSVHHAREVISPQQTIFFMWYLLENYNIDPEIKRIVDNTELYFVPVINPDGYAYNVLTDPDGGGMWRKNRRDNGDGTFGVDPNRNYNYFWGLDNEGSSPYTYDETYRGPAPFSEPEIKNMRDFCNEHEFQIALNYHSHGNLLLAPWGYTPEPPPDSEVFHAYGELMTKENNYTHGPGSTTIYPTNGGSDDWMYGEQDAKDLIYSYTPEVGGGNDGFWPSVSRIIPLCQEQMWQNITAARLVGNYGTVKDLSPMVTDQIENHAAFNVTRLGLADTETFTVSIESLDNHIVETSSSVNFNNMELLEVSIDSITYLLDTGIENGTIYRYLLSIDNGDFVLADTITKVFGTEVAVFEDDCETTDKWTSNKWDITDEAFYSPSFSITDSPDGDYQHDENSNITLDTTINLSGASIAFLRFWAKWDIEKEYDYVQVLAKEVGSNNWEALHGIYSSYGNYYLEQNDPVYDGTQDEWVQEEINLIDFINKEINLRFIFYSDSYVKGDGFYFDDLAVTVISQITGMNDIEKEKLFVSQPYPNPSTTSVRVQYNLSDNKHSVFEIFDLSGNKVYSQLVKNKKGILNISLENLPSGIYYYRIQNGQLFSKSSKLIKL